MENKKSSGIFMKACLIMTALWLFAVAVVVVYFHAIGRPLDPVVTAFLFSPGIGELGFSSLVKTAKEKAGAESAETEIAALRAELEALKAKPGKRASTSTSDAERAKTAVTPREQKQVRAMLEQMLPSLVTNAQRIYGVGTGPLKFSFVLEKVYARLPDTYKMFFTVDQLGDMVDKALFAVRELWLMTPALIARTETG